MLNYDLREFLKVTNLGADLLLPIFCYIVTISKSENLFAEWAFIEEFINESFIEGEDGYALANLQTVINVINELE